MVNLGVCFELHTKDEGNKIYYLFPSLSLPCLFFDFVKIYKHNIVKIVQGGAVIQCPGLFCGEVIANLDSSSKVITFTMMATNPDIDCFSSAFSELVSLSFVQCIQMFHTHLS